MTSTRTDDELTQTSTKATTPAKSIPRRRLVRVAVDDDMGPVGVATDGGGGLGGDGGGLGGDGGGLGAIPDENNPHCWPVPDPSVQHVYK